MDALQTTKNSDSMYQKVPFQQEGISFELLADSLIQNEVRIFVLIDGKTSVDGLALLAGTEVADLYQVLLHFETIGLIHFGKEVEPDEGISKFQSRLTSRNLPQWKKDKRNAKGLQLFLKRRRKKVVEKQKSDAHLRRISGKSNMPKEVSHKPMYRSQKPTHEIPREFRNIPSSLLKSSDLELAATYDFLSDGQNVKSASEPTLFDAPLVKKSEEQEQPFFNDVPVMELSREMELPLDEEFAPSSLELSVELKPSLISEVPKEESFSSETLVIVGTLLDSKEHAEIDSGQFSAMKMFSRKSPDDFVYGFSKEEGLPSSHSALPAQSNDENKKSFWSTESADAVSEEEEPTEGGVSWDDVDAPIILDASK